MRRLGRITHNDPDKHEAGHEAVDGKLGKLVAREPEAGQARLIEAGVAHRRPRPHVLLQRPQHQHRRRRVDHVVRRDEERVEHRLIDRVKKRKREKGC